MRNLFAKLWADDCGVVITEYLILGTFLALTLIVGVATLAHAINVELGELAAAILTFSQTYSVSGYSTCRASKEASGATDTVGTFTYGSSSTTSGVDVTFCAP